MGNRDLTQLEPDKAATPTPLSFYDPELQNAWNAVPVDRERIVRANQRATSLKAAYKRQLMALSERMSKDTFSRFSNPRELLFDAELFKFSVGDALSYSEPRRRMIRLSTSVEATFCSFDGKTLHHLAYRGISAVKVDLPDARWFTTHTGYRVDSLLADELTSLDSERMKHAFLFVSGTTISIEFRKVNWKTTRNHLQ